MATPPTASPRGFRGALAASVAAVAAALGCQGPAATLVGGPWTALRTPRPAPTAAADATQPAPVGWPPHVVLDRTLDPALQASLRGELVVLGARLEQTLGVAPGTQRPVVTVFGNEDLYRSYVRQRYPDFPYRRALFAERQGRLEAVAFYGPHLREDLCHEATHAYLHGAGRDLPLWLDEGLAEYFETRPTPGSPQPQHVATLLRLRACGGWQPSLVRLAVRGPDEALSEEEYAEAWLWAHYLLGEPDSAAEVRRSLRGTYPPLEESLQRVVPGELTAGVLRHLDALAAALPPEESSSESQPVTAPRESVPNTPS